MKSIRFLPILYVSVLLLVGVSTHGRQPLCPEGALEQELTPEEGAFLEDFGAALRRFRGMTLEEFEAEYGPKKSYRGTGFIRGDSNGDGGLDISDAVCALGFLFLGDSCWASGPFACRDALDAQDDGEIDITDPIYLLAHLFLGDPEPPPPFPERGEDPTPDPLACSMVSGKLDYHPFEAQYLDRILDRFPLTGDQDAALIENGFVVLDSPVMEGQSPRKFYTFLEGLNEVFRSDLPVYISVDVILDALHLSFDEILKTIEEELLIDVLDRMLRKMEDGLEDLRKYSPTEQELDWVDFWICTARSLLDGQKAPCARPVDAEVEKFLGYAYREELVAIELFGVQFPGDEPEDFTQFRPRSHYTRSEELRNYFRSMMWVQRIGMRFAECRNHAAVAFLLARCLQDTGAGEEWERLNAVIEALVGVSDSLNPQGMLGLAGQTGVSSVADLRDPEDFQSFIRTAHETGAGRQLINSQVLAWNPTYIDGFTPIPPVFQLMGQRFIVDSFVFTNVVWDRVETHRNLPSPLDAWFVLGNRAAVPLLRDEIERWEYHPHLAAMDWIVSRYNQEFWSANLYHAWLDALRSLSLDTTRDPYPAVMQTEEWDLRVLHAQLASWAQLRHDTILYAKPSYTVGDCEYPEGWVDPYPDFYRKISAFAARVIERLEPLGIFEIGGQGPFGGTADFGARIRKCFEGFRDHCSTLAEIAQAELEGREFSVDEREFLKAVLKRIPAGAGGSIAFHSYNGWYIDLIFVMTDRVTLPGFYPTVADIHTCTPLTDGCGDWKILHAAVAHPDLMIITVKNDCGVKAYAGPVLSYHEFIHSERMTDEDWKERLEWFAEPTRPAWARRFIVR